MKLMLDAGHGGKDSGAIGNGMMEKDLTLKIALKIGKLLEDYQGVEVFYTRKDDRFIELAERANLANKNNVDYFTSVHINATPSGTGFESYTHYDASDASIAYQNMMHTEIMKAIGNVRDRGKKKANHAVTRLTHMPAILTENLFIDNVGDGALLKQDSFLDKIAQGHVNGYAKAFGLIKKTEHVTPKIVYFYTGGYVEGNDSYKKVEKFLKDNGFWYQIK